MHTNPFNWNLRPLKQLDKKHNWWHLTLLEEPLWHTLFMLAEKNWGPMTELSSMCSTHVCTIAHLPIEVTWVTFLKVIFFLKIEGYVNTKSYRTTSHNLVIEVHLKSSRKFDCSFFFPCIFEFIPVKCFIEGSITVLVSLTSCLLAQDLFWILSLPGWQLFSRSIPRRYVIPSQLLWNGAQPQFYFRHLRCVVTMQLYTSDIYMPLQNHDMSLLQNTPVRTLLVTMTIIKKSYFSVNKNRYRYSK